MSSWFRLIVAYLLLLRHQKSIFSSHAATKSFELVCYYYIVFIMMMSQSLVALGRRRLIRFFIILNAWLAAPTLESPVKL